MAKARARFDASSGGVELVPKYTSYMCAHGPPYQTSFCPVVATPVAPFAIDRYDGLSGGSGTNGTVSMTPCGFELFHIRSNWASNQVKISVFGVK